MSESSSEPTWREGHRHWLIGTIIALIGVLIAATSLYQDYRNNHRTDLKTLTTEETTTTKPFGGWGPERSTFTMHNPPSYAILNSITDNGKTGDERNFTRVRNMNRDEKYEDVTRAEVNDLVSIYVEVHNDCANELAGPASTIHGLYMRYVPQTTGTDIVFQVFLGGENIMTVYNGATVVVNEDAHLELIPGSAKMLTNSTTDAGFPLDTLAIARGDNVLLGETKPDGEYPTGRIPGTEDKDYGAGYVEFQARVVKGA